MLKMLWLLILIGALAAITGCPTFQNSRLVIEPSADSKMIETQEILKRLQTNRKKMDRIYQDVRLIAEGHIFYGSDEQLSTIQKSSLYMLLANRTAQRQDDLITLLAYVGKERKTEYFDFITKDLKQAVFDSASDLNNLNILYAFIENQSARENVDQAVKIIRDNIDLYKELVGLLSPTLNTNPDTENSKVP